MRNSTNAPIITVRTGEPVKSVKDLKEELQNTKQKVIKERILNNNFSCKDDRDRIVDAFKRLANKYNKLHTFGVYNEVTHVDITLNDKTYSVVDLDYLKDEARYVYKKLQDGKSVTVRGINFVAKDGRMIAGRGRYYTAEIKEGNILDIILYWLASAIFADFELGYDNDFDEYYKYREPYEFCPRYSLDEYKARVSAVANGESEEDYEAIADEIEGDVITIYDDIIGAGLDDSYGDYSDKFAEVEEYLVGLKCLVANCEELSEVIDEGLFSEADDVLDYISE